MRALPLPPPWRRFLGNHRAIDSASAEYARINEAYEQRHTRLIPDDLVGRWRTQDGTVEIEFVDSGRLATTFQAIGRHDGRVFRWARPDDIGAAGQAATAFRNALARLVPQLPLDDELAIGQRDVVALMSLAAQALDVRRLFCAPSRDGSLRVMRLDDPAPAQTANRGAGWLGNLMSRFRAEPPPTSPPASPPTSPLRLVDELIARQVAAVQVQPDVLATVERIAADAAAAYDAGDFAQALDRIADAKARLGRFVVDQEPSGWLFACEGACHLALAQPADAAAAFRQSLQCLLRPDDAIVRLGLARAEATPAARDSALSAVYLSAPERFGQLATSEERASMTARIDRLEATRAPDQDAEATLHAALAERCAHEREAWRLNEQAATHRTERHVLCEEDEIARATYTATYRDLLLAWFTVPVTPVMGSIGSAPREDPARLRSLSATPVDDVTMDFTAIFSTEHGSENTYRYRLVRGAIPLSTRPLWRIAGIWSVWPDEEIPLL